MTVNPYHSIAQNLQDSALPNSSDKALQDRLTEVNDTINKLQTAITPLTSIKAKIDELKAPLKPYKSSLKEIEKLDKEISRYTTNFILLNADPTKLNNLFTDLETVKGRIPGYDEVHKKVLEINEEKKKFNRREFDQKLIELELAKKEKAYFEKEIKTANGYSENSDTQSTSDED